jgi:hypothetical protein
MLQCYVLTCGRSVTAFLAPPRSQHPGQGPARPTQRPALMLMEARPQDGTTKGSESSLLQYRRPLSSRNVTGDFKGKRET